MVTTERPAAEPAAQQPNGSGKPALPVGDTGGDAVDNTAGNTAVPDGHAPHWFELGTLAAAVTLATVGSAGLLLAVIGHYSTLAALWIGLPLAAVGVVILHRGLPRGRSSSAAHAGAVIAVLIGVGYAVLAGLTPSQNVVVSRDPGSYVTTARQLAREGALELDVRGQAFAGVRGLWFAGAAVYDTGPRFPPKDVPGPARRDPAVRLIIEPQFNHLTSVALAVAFDVGGQGLMFRLPALMAGFGLLLVYALTMRITRRPFVSLLAPALPAACLPMLYVARNTYSEPFALVLLWGAILVLVVAHQRPRALMGAVGGVLLGAVICTRVDAALYAVLLLPLAAVSVGAAGSVQLRNARLRTWGAGILAAAVLGGLGWFDVDERSGGYVISLASELGTLRLAVIAVAAISAIALAAWFLIPPLRTRARRVSRPAAIVGATVVAGALLFGWLIRPHIQAPTGGLVFSAVETIQQAEGLPVEPTRTYAEESLQWMAWYLGIPALVAAIFGLSWATWRTLRGRIGPAALVALTICLGGGALYWYDPQITPDQLWATRRFVPAVFPALSIWAAVAVAVVFSLPRIAVAGRVLRIAGATAVAALLLIPPVLTTTPLLWMRTQAGYLQPIQDTCEQVGPDAAVIVLGGWGRLTLPQSLRSWCGVPVAAEGSAISPDKLPALAAQIKANGYRLYLVAPNPGLLEVYRVPGGPQPASSSSVDQFWVPESTLDRPPERYIDPAAALPVPTPFTLYSLEVVSP